MAASKACMTSDIAVDAVRSRIRTRRAPRASLLPAPGSRQARLKWHGQGSAHGFLLDHQLSLSGFSHMSIVRLPSLYKHSTRFCPSSFLSLSRYYSEDVTQRDHSASAKLFQDAAKEEAEEAERAARAARLNAQLAKQENWTGEESMQDAVLRMLVDKYKPLRSGSILTADEKLKKAPPRVRDFDRSLPDDVEGDGLGCAADVVQTTWGASSRSLAGMPLLPSIEGHQPWHTTFQVPSHAQSSIKYGQVSVAPRNTSMPPPVDDKARRQARELRKKTEQAGRLRNAKESTLDYKLGPKDGKGAQGTVRRRANPLDLKGWASLVEDRIEVRLACGVSCDSQAHCWFRELAKRVASITFRVADNP